MPEDLQAHIKSLPEGHRKQVWVSCRGENGADQEILNDIEYYPTRGFPHYFYPYVNTKGYLSPLVAVKFVRPLRKYFFLNFLSFKKFFPFKTFQSFFFMIPFHNFLYIFLLFCYQQIKS
jgi:hypothetical protein